MATIEAKTKKRMDKIGFFRLCEELRNRREVLTTERPNLAQTAAQMSERLGIHVEPGQVKDAKKVTGIEWQAAPHPVRTGKRISGEEKHIRMRVVVQAVVRLYKKLGEEVPSDLTEVLSVLVNGYPAKETPQS